MQIIREFGGEEWEHWMNHEGEEKARKFQEIAAKHGVKVLVNKECYTMNGHNFGNPVSPYMGYWLKPNTERNFSDIWREVEETEEWKR